MFRELVELGRDLECKKRLPPPGFYSYSEPIRWVVHLWSDRIYLEAVEIDTPRPFSGRTSGIQPHLLADEAAYALGVGKQKGGVDRNAASKHASFRELLARFRRWEGLRDPALQEALDLLWLVLDEGRVREDPRYGDILAKDWVSFVPEEGPLAGRHLFEHPEAMAFWLVELQSRSNPGDGANKFQVFGPCAVCGEQRSLIGRIPLGVKLAGTKPLHSLNADAFTSFQSGSDTFKRSHLGVCFECGDTAARAFNHLIASDQHHRMLARDDQRRDGLGNQMAIFWLKAPAPVQVGDRVLDVGDLTQVDWGSVLEESRARKGAPEATPSQLLELLRLPWKPWETTLQLDDYAFFLGVVSPNVGRIAVREWIHVSLMDFKEHLREFLEGVRMVSPYGDPPHPLAMSTIIEALRVKNPNIARGLLRTAFMGVRPPVALSALGVATLRNPRVLLDPRESLRLHAAASAIKLSLFHGREEGERMSALNPAFKSRAYLCGRLLAILEEAQLRAANFNLNRTLVERFYGAASTAPAATFGGLVRLATTAHLPETGKELNQLMEEVMSSLDEAGGFPRTLSLAEQAEFGLGFYHQRAAFRAKRRRNKDEGGME